MMSYRSLSALLPFACAALFTTSAFAQQKVHATDAKPQQATNVDMAKAVEIGKPAPDFTLKDINGKTVKLSDYKGKTVVLEWFNPGCPFVVAAHGENGALRGMAEAVKADGIVWLSINSSAPGKEGSDLEMNKKAVNDWKIMNPVLIDATGEVGMKYGAKTTPHMFVIDMKGNLVYRGALDNAPMGKLPEDAKEKINYVKAALADLKMNKAVATPETKSYGCSVKYMKPGA